MSKRKKKSAEDAINSPAEFDAEAYVAGRHPDALAVFKLREALKDEKRNKDELVARLAKAEERLEQALAIKDPSSPPKLKTKKVKGTRTATPVLMASDWHVEEPVLPAQVNGRNSYDLDEAKRRSQNFWDGAAWLTKWMRNPLDGAAPFSARKMLLWLGGDMITSYLHDENEETNLLSPLQAVIFAQGLIMQGINHLLSECELEQLVVVCNWGNHGRMHKRKRYKSAAKNNLEWLMYHTIAQVYENDDRVIFQIAAGAHEYACVEGHWIRFVHGDDWNYQGGVGGLSVPLLRGVQRLDAGSPYPVELTVLGHFHQLRDYGAAVVNGSLIGYNEYALSKSFPYEPPQQGFFLVDEKRGKCMSTPLWVAEAPGRGAA